MFSIGMAVYAQLLLLKRKQLEEQVAVALHFIPKSVVP